MHRLFEEIVAKICSTQDLQVAFHELQKVLKAHSNIEGVFLGHHVPDSREVYNLAYADSRCGHNLNYRRAADDELHDYLLSSRRGEMNVIASLADFPAMARTLSSHIPARSSLYEFRVRLDGAHIGMLAFHTPAPCLSEDLLNLLMKIRGPVALALANRLRALSAWPSPGSPATRFPARDDFFHIQGVSPAMKEVYRILQLAAPTDSTLLLTGETGVGKEVFARYAHALSAKSGKPFVHVNCGGIAEALIDSELFGHKKGSFTGAIADHAGFFEQARGGTIFLDEIGEFPMDAQARLLLVLQNKTIRRVGDTRPTPLDIRIIAATNCDIERMCREGRFRKDLYYRLNSIKVVIPPLRMRREDIPNLAEQFLQKAAQELGLMRVPGIPPGEMARLVRHSWPGNVRELENCIKRSLILGGGAICRVDIPAWDDGTGLDLLIPGEGAQPAALLVESIGREAAPPVPAESAGFDGRRSACSLDDATRLHMEEALQRAGGRVHGPGGAAELLGVNPSTLRSRMRKLGVSFGRSGSISR